ncbi:MAG: hypothetical protein PHW77_04830 [Eubacteriales bacterium]|nr:hypothetical protein [Eubacteriales bacterium]
MENNENTKYTYPAKKKYVFKITAICLAVCVLAGIAFGVYKITAGSDKPVSKDWSIESNTAGNIKMRMADAGRTVTLNVDYSALSESSSVTEDFDAETDIFIKMFGEWLTSICKSDYDRHFSLFQPEFVQSMFTSRIAKEGLSYDEAIANIHEIGFNAYGYYSMEFRYSLVHITVPDEEELESIRDTYTHRFSEAGLDVSKIEAFIRYDFADPEIIINECYLTNTDDDLFGNFLFYKYNGIWYIFPNLMEDDHSIDLAYGDNSYYITEATVSGVVEDVGKYYVVLIGGMNFLVENTDGISIGDSVTVIYYSASPYLCKIGNDSICNIHTAKAVIPSGVQN